MLSGIGLCIGCIITGLETTIAEDDLDDYCDSTYSNPDNNEACRQLQEIQRLVIALTVSINEVLRKSFGFKVMFILTHVGN